MLSRTGARQWWQRLTEISIVPAAAVSSSVLPRICKAWSGAWRPSNSDLRGTATPSSIAGAITSAIAITGEPHVD